jgi:hypothetical protein
MTALPPCPDVDADLVKRVRIFLISSRNDFSALDVQAQDGVVCLSGTLPTYYLRQLATACVRRVAGVRHVIDGLNVSYDDGHDSAGKPHAFDGRPAHVTKAHQFAEN